MRRMIPGVLIEKIKKLFTNVWTDEQGNVEVGKNLEVSGNASFGKKGFVIYEGSIKGYSNPKPGYYIEDSTLWFYIESSASSPRAYCSGITSALGGLQLRVIENDGEPQSKKIPLTADLPKFYRHHLTLTTAGGEEHQDYYASSNLVVNSLPNLSTITGKHPFGSGENEYKFNATTNTWERWTSSGTETVTKVTDDVRPL